MDMKNKKVRIYHFMAMGVILASFCWPSFAKDPIPPLAPLPELTVEADKAELGKNLFFDTRISGNAAISCSQCHQPSKGWGDGMDLSKGYPGTNYFRNAKSLLNAAHSRYFHWDARLSGKDIPTLVRDQITESFFHNMDGRLMFMRLQQVPEYRDMFQKAFGKEPNFGSTLKAIAEFQKTIVSKNVPFDEFLNGDKNAISKSAKKGLKIFKGKGRCIQCHNGPNFSDNKVHALGVPENPKILNEPDRHVTLRAMFKFMGVDNFENAREDVGFYTVSKQDKDRGKFLTPTLREVAKTYPYMHNGMLGSLDEVLNFYNQGGGKNKNKDPLLKPLKLSSKELQYLKDFLHTLSGEEIIIEQPPFYGYKPVQNWMEVEN